MTAHSLVVNKFDGYVTKEDMKKIVQEIKMINEKVDINNVEK